MAETDSSCNLISESRLQEYQLNFIVELLDSNQELEYEISDVEDEKVDNKISDPENEYDDEKERDDNSSGFMDELESSQYNLF